MNQLTHFAINADDVPRTRRFYEQVFDWTFEAWGPPDFYRVAGDGRPGAALQARRSLVHGERTLGFECTVEVADVDAAVRAALAAGGRVLMARTTIAGVGHLVFLADPSDNVVGVMQYDPDAE